MAETAEEIILVFKTTHQTLTVEKGLKEARIRLRTMVKPRNISSECALALSIRNADRERVRQLCKEKGWRPIGCYRQEEDGSWRALEDD
mgnify:CR=1 FL=1